MSAIKKFSVFCGGFAAFSAAIYLFGQFMSYDPRVEEELSILDRFKMFLSREPVKDYYLYLMLLGLLLLTLALSLIFRKHPWIGFAASILPLLRLMSMFSSEKLYERPMLYVLLCVVQSAGLLYECIRMDRADGKRRAAFGTDLVALIGILLCFYTVAQAEIVATLDPSTLPDLSFFQQKLYFHLEDADLSVFYRPAIALGATLILRWILRDVYFLDAVLAVVPAVYSIWLFNTEAFPFHGILFVTLTVIYAIARIAIAISCPPKGFKLPVRT